MFALACCQDKRCRSQGILQYNKDIFKKSTLKCNYPPELNLTLCYLV